MSASRSCSSALAAPRTVHHEGKGGFAGLLTDQARRTGVAGYPASSTHTREALGWRPTHPSLLEDLKNIQP
jgi:hypothetical protein